MPRLTEIESSFLKLETPAQLLHLCYVFEVDASTIPGGYTFAAFQPMLGNHIRTIAGARSKIFDPLFNLDNPVRADDKDFDIDRHCHRITAPVPGEPHQIAETIAHIAGQPLDRSRALWEVSVIEGAASGHLILLFKIHLSVLSDDPATNLISQLSGTAADLPVRETITRDPEPNPFTIAFGGLVGAAARPARIAGGVALSIPHVPGMLIGTVRRRSVPLTPFNRNITGRRNVAYLQLPRKDIDVIDRKSVV